MNNLDRVKLGDKVKDEVTGFEGVATAATEFLQGCRRISITSQDLHDGKPIDSHWFDEPQITIVKKAVVKAEVVDEGEQKTGGPAYLTPTSKDYKESR